MLKAVVLVLLVGLVSCQDLSNLVDVKTLSELPLEKLLHVKNSFIGAAREVLEAPKDDFVVKGALALKGLRPPLKKSDWEEEKGGSKKTTSIFQISVTTLAFLAFGGYLLCLIVESIKEKGHKVIVVIPVTTTTTTMATTTMMMNGRRRRRRRPRPSRYRRRPAPARPKRDVEDFSGPGVLSDVDPDQMLDALVTLSEAYTRYHTVDYERFNRTFARF